MGEYQENKGEQKSHEEILLEKINAKIGMLGGSDEWLKLEELPKECEILKNKKIVMVDDLQKVLEGYVSGLMVATDGKADFILHENQSFEELIDEIARRYPDIVLMDKNLANKINGITMTRELLAKYPEIKVVGFSSEGEGNDFIRSGAVGSVRKSNWDPIESIKNLADLIKVMEQN